MIMQGTEADVKLEMPANHAESVARCHGKVMRAKLPPSLASKSRRLRRGAAEEPGSHAACHAAAASNVLAIHGLNAAANDNGFLAGLRRFYRLRVSE